MMHPEGGGWLALVACDASAAPSERKPACAPPHTSTTHTNTMSWQSTYRSHDVNR